MKELLSLTGGYKRHMNYLLTLQAEVLGVQNALLKNLGHDLVLSGCEVTDNLNGTVNIAPGVVYVGGEVARFGGSSNVTADGSKAMELGAPVTTEPKEFYDTLIKNTYKERFANVVNTSSTATQIVIRTAVLYGIKDYIADVVQSYGQKGETKWVVDLDGGFLDNFDGSGAGITAKWLGWHLMNGNAGAPTMAGRTPIGVGALVDTYGLEHNYTNNQEGGQPRHKLVINEHAAHNHSVGGAMRNGVAGSGFGSGANIFNNTAFNTSSSGGDQPHNNMQPFRAGYWVIKMT